MLLSFCVAVVSCGKVSLGILTPLPTKKNSMHCLNLSTILCFPNVQGLSIFEQFAGQPFIVVLVISHPSPQILFFSAMSMVVCVDSLVDHIFLCSISMMTAPGWVNSWSGKRVGSLGMKVFRRLEWKLGKV